MVENESGDDVSGRVVWRICCQYVYVNEPATFDNV